MKIKDLFNRVVNKNNKQVSFSLKKRLVIKKGIDIKEVLDMELNKDNFLK